MEEKVINIGGRIHDTSSKHTVTGANEVLDDDLQKKQSVINAEQLEHNQESDNRVEVLENTTVRFTPQSLTEGEQERARQNISTYSKEQVNNIVSRTPETDVIVIDVPVASQSDIAGWLDANTPSGIDPETGRSVRANKLYRVPGPTNTTFSEWAWDGTAYIMLDNKDYGIDNEPIDKSNNMAKSGGIFRMLSEKISCDSVNLYKLDEFILNYYLTSSGYEQPDGNNQHAISNYIPVKEQSITLDCNISLYAAICVYDKDKNFLRSITPETIQTKYTYTYQSGDYYIRATVKKDRFNTVMANYGNSLEDYEPYNPIGRYLPKLPVFSVSVQNHFNRFIKELYLADLDNSKYYYIYSLGSYIYNGITNYSLYIGVSNTKEISTPVTIAAYYDSPNRPKGIVALSGSNGSYAVLDFTDIDSVSDNILNFGRNTLLNNSAISSLDYNPIISLLFSEMKEDNKLGKKVDVNSTNLYIPEKFKVGYIISGNGNEQQVEGANISNFIPVNGNDITLVCTLNPYHSIAVYDENKNRIRLITSETLVTEYTYHYQSGDAYIRADIYDNQVKMANYGNSLEDYEPYNPIVGYLPKPPYFSFTKENYLNRYIKELYLKGADPSKFYYVYSLGLNETSNVFYIGVSDTEEIVGTTVIAAYYDSTTKPDGLVALRAPNLTTIVGYAVLDFDNADPLSEMIEKVGRKTLLNKNVIRSLDFNPRINSHVNPNDISVNISDCTISLYREGAIVFFNRIVTSPYTSDYNIYKLEGEAIDQKKDIIFRNYNLRGATVQFVTAWDSTDRFLGSFATVNEDTTPLQDDGWYNIIAKTSQYKNIAYLLFVVYSARMPDISTKIYNNLSFLPEEDKGSETIRVSKDGTGEYTKISDAINYANNKANTIIEVDAGEYDLIEELGADYFANMENTYYQGLKLGNGVVLRATGNGVVIKAQYTGSNVYVGYQFSIFNVSGTCTVEGISFIGHNIRYIIHDDLPAGTYPNVNQYIVTFRNCTFNHKGSTMYDPTQSIPVAVGGGCTKNSLHIWDGCIFESEANVSEIDIAYHNSATSNSKVVLKECYFINGKTLQSRAFIPTGGTIFLYLCGNRFGAALEISDPEKITVISFNNSFT